jgi:hypothetical protein
MLKALPGMGGAFALPEQLLFFVLGKGLDNRIKGEGFLLSRRSYIRQIGTCVPIQMIFRSSWINCFGNVI